MDWYYDPQPPQPSPPPAATTPALFPPGYRSPFAPVPSTLSSAVRAPGAGFAASYHQQELASYPPRPCTANYRPPNALVYYDPYSPSYCQAPATPGPVPRTVGDLRVGTPTSGTPAPVEGAYAIEEDVFSFFDDWSPNAHVKPAEGSATSMSTTVEGKESAVNAGPFACHFEEVPGSRDSLASPPSVDEDELARRAAIRAGKRRAVSASPPSRSSGRSARSSSTAAVDPSPVKNKNKVLTPSDLSGGSDEIDGQLPAALLNASEVQAVEFEYKGVGATADMANALNAVVGTDSFVSDKRTSSAEVASFEFLPHGGKAAAKNRPTLLFSRSSGTRSAAGWEANLKRVYPLAVHVWRTYLGATESGLAALKVNKRPKLAPEADMHNIAVFCKKAGARSDPFSWTTGPKTVPEKHIGRVFIQHLKSKTNPPGSALIIGLAGLTTSAAAWIKILKAVPADFRLFFSLQMGRYVAKAKTPLFLAALEGRLADTDDFHRSLVSSLDAQAASRLARDSAIADLGEENWRQPRHQAFEYNKQGQQLCSKGCSRQAQQDNMCLTCLDDERKHRYTFVDSHGRRCLNKARTDKRTHCAKHANQKQACVKCQTKTAQLYPSRLCYKCTSPEYKMAKWPGSFAAVSVSPETALSTSSSAGSPASNPKKRSSMSRKTPTPSSSTSSITRKATQPRSQVQPIYAIDDDEDEGAGKGSADDDEWGRDNDEYDASGKDEEDDDETDREDEAGNGFR